MRAYKVTPVPKPRMTRRDQWDERPAVMRYRSFKDQVYLHKIKLATSCNAVIFIVPVPASWPEKKKSQYIGQPHKQRPDVDNYLKGLLDAVFREDDSEVWDIRATKIWGARGMILIFDMEEPNMVVVE